MSEPVASDPSAGAEAGRGPAAAAGGERRLTGLGVSHGRAAGPVIRMAGPPVLPPPRPVTDQTVELAAIAQALDALVADLTHRATALTSGTRPGATPHPEPPAAAGPGAGSSAAADGGEVEGVEVLEALAVMAADPVLREDAERYVRQGSDAVHALDAAFSAHAATLAALGGYLAERAADLEDLKHRAAAFALGLPVPGVPAPGHPFVLVAEDLSPADTAGLGPDVLALVTERGGPTSHTAILARGRGLPAVVACAGVSALADGTVIGVDGATGEVVVGLTEEEAGRIVREERARRTRLAGARGRGRTRDGHPVTLLLNIGSANDLRTRPGQHAGSTHDGSPRPGQHTDSAHDGSPRPGQHADSIQAFRRPWQDAHSTYDSQAVAGHRRGQDPHSAPIPESIRENPGPAHTPQTAGEDPRLAHSSQTVGEERGPGPAVWGDVEGVGLFRTEFLFLGRAEAPSYEEQVAAYAEVFAEVPREAGPVVVRTLDAGTDKPLPFLRLPEEPNPALGVRGLRVDRLLPGVLDTQLDAIAEAARLAGADVSVMAPMVATPGEAAAFARRVRARGFARVGVMVEVPAAALRASRILREVDFLSVGTNDLAQYAFAADRQHPGLADLLDPAQPALLALVEMCARAGLEAGKPVGVCGEAAGDPLVAPLLVGLGVTSLSMAPVCVPLVRDALAGLTLEECRERARTAMNPPG
ncbi:putative PEP-binding protein [Nonomuraea pusilla]|uniref:phosphoenolpyruvate--protein phosphotransferase n=1 Tax=Nonomuraea pusilla TaxID=46177 RepID=UPI003324CDA5